MPFVHSHDAANINVATESAIKSFVRHSTATDHTGYVLCLLHTSYLDHWVDEKAGFHLDANLVEFTLTARLRQLVEVLSQAQVHMPVRGVDFGTQRTHVLKHSARTCATTRDEHDVTFM